MGPFEMVVAIVAIVMISSIIRAKAGLKHGKLGEVTYRADPDATQLKAEVAQLKDRIAVLERIATDNNSRLDLDREIERLR